MTYSMSLECLRHQSPSKSNFGSDWGGSRKTERVVRIGCRTFYIAY